MLRGTGRTDPLVLPRILVLFFCVCAVAAVDVAIVVVVVVGGGCRWLDDDFDSGIDV